MTLGSLTPSDINRLKVHPPQTTHLCETRVGAGKVSGRVALDKAQGGAGGQTFLSLHLGVKMVNKRVKSKMVLVLAFPANAARSQAPVVCVMFKSW